jgi:hypothetical protein
MASRLEDMRKTSKAIALYQQDPEWVPIRTHMAKRIVHWLAQHGEFPQALALIAQVWKTDDEPTTIEEARLIYNMILADSVVSDGS